jgi:hypothetical protein
MITASVRVYQPDEPIDSLVALATLGMPSGGFSRRPCSGFSCRCSVPLTPSLQSLNPKRSKTPAVSRSVSARARAAEGLRRRVRRLSGPLAALHRRTQQAPYQAAIAGRLGGRRAYPPGYRKDRPVTSPFPNDVCWPATPVCTVTSVVCSGAHGVRNNTCAECNLPASVCNDTNATGGHACAACSGTQALGRFSYGNCGPTNIVRGPTNVVCGAVWPRFSRHFPTCRPHEAFLRCGDCDRAQFEGPLYIHKVALHYMRNREVAQEVGSSEFRSWRP